MELGRREASTPDNSLPDPESLPFDPDEMEWMYQLWAIWTATEKRYLPSQLIPELLSGHGRILTGLFDMESLYSKVKAQFKKQTPNE
jgi:hypothetical protein